MNVSIYPISNAIFVQINQVINHPVVVRIQCRIRATLDQVGYAVIIGVQIQIIGNSVPVGIYRRDIIRDCVVQAVGIVVPKVIGNSVEV